MPITEKTVFSVKPLFKRFKRFEKSLYVIEIVLPGVGESQGKTAYIKTGWMILPDRNIRLNTPFTGFSGRRS